MRLIRRLLAGWLMCGGLAGCVTLPAALPDGSASAKSTEADAAAQLPPEQTAKIQMALAEEMAKKGDRAGAVVQYEKARANDPSLDGRVSHRLGVLYDELDDRPKSLDEFQRALKTCPHDASLLSDLGYCHYCRGDWADAEKYLRQALEVDGGAKRARMNLGMTLAQQGKCDAALEAFGKVVSPAEAQANLGYILLAQGKRDEAHRAYERALELEPNLRVARAALTKMDAPAAPKTNG